MSDTMDFNTRKLWFYAGLDKDPLVQSTRSERTIRDTVESIILYANHANRANLEFQSKKRRKIEGPLGSLDGIAGSNPEVDALLQKLPSLIDAMIVAQSKAATLDFRDVESIAYEVGTYRDSRNPLQRLLARENPLDAKVKRFADHYAEFQKSGTLSSDYLDDDVEPHLQAAADIHRDNSSRCAGIDGMLRKSCEYINRQCALLTLADRGQSIIDMYFTDSKRNFRRLYIERDVAGAVANFPREELTGRQLRNIQRYLRRQAEIDGFAFRMLYSSSHMLLGVPRPFEETDRMHNKTLEERREHGRSELVYTTSDALKQQIELSSA